MKVHIVGSGGAGFGGAGSSEVGSSGAGLVTEGCGGVGLGGAGAGRAGLGGAAGGAGFGAQLMPAVATIHITTRHKINIRDAFELRMTLAYLQIE